MNEVSWESLIKDRMRPCIRLAIEDPVERARKMKEERRKKNPSRIAYKKKYREGNHDILLEKKRAYNATEHGKKMNSEYNAKWREKNKEYDKKRKAEWWKKKHPNPKPIGRPRKTKEQDEQEISTTP